MNILNKSDFLAKEAKTERKENIKDFFMEFAMVILLFITIHVGCGLYQASLTLP